MNEDQNIKSQQERNERRAQSTALIDREEKEKFEEKLDFKNEVGFFKAGNKDLQLKVQTKNMHRIAKIFEDDDESEEEAKIIKSNNTFPAKDTVSSFNVRNQKGNNLMKSELYKSYSDPRKC